MTTTSTSKRRMFIAFVLIIPSAILLIVLFTRRGGNVSTIAEVDRIAKNLAGSNVVDCGLKPLTGNKVGTDGAEVLKAMDSDFFRWRIVKVRALAAFQKGRPFIMRADYSNDNPLALCDEKRVIIVGNKAGKLYKIWFDFDSHSVSPNTEVRWFKKLCDETYITKDFTKQTLR